MPVTLGDLVNDVESHLYAFGESRDKVTTLTSTMTTSDTSLTVTDGQLISRGMAEIENELVAVASVDVSTGAVTLHPWGRAQGGSSAAAHAANVRVASNPRFPRSRIIREVDDALTALYPTLFAVRVEDLGTFVPLTYEYELPASGDSVISMRWQDPTGTWHYIDRFRVETGDDGARHVTMDWPIPAGQPLQAYVRKGFGHLVNTTDTLLAAGAREEWRDLIVTKAVANMIKSLDFARLQLDAVESNSRADKTPPASAASVARNLMALYAARLQSERRALLLRYPPRQVRVE